MQLAYQRASGAGTSTGTGTNWGQPAGTQTSTAINIKASTTTTIQIEDFDAGAEGTAYHDLEAANIGNNSYRTGTGVDIINTTDTGSTRSVGGTKAGEWLRYTVNVEKTGTYNIDYRVANRGAGAGFYLSLDGKNVGSMTVPDTRNWNTYTTVTKTGVYMTAGRHTLWLAFVKNGTSGYAGDFNWMRFSPGIVPATPAPAPAPAPATSPFKSVTAFAGRDTYIQAEDFDLGPEGLAYHDTDSGNLGRQYRSTGVDLQTSTDTGGGYMVGYTKAGEYLKYTFNVGAAGTFNLDTRLANVASGATFHIEIDGKNVTGTQYFANTGAWNKWATIRKSGIALTAGKHTLRLVIDSTAGRAYAGVVNWMKLS